MLTPLLLAVTFSTAPGDWQAGFAKVVITPQQPMWMAGYAARTGPAEGADTELYAKAAVLQASGQQPLVLVTLDLCGFDRETSGRIIDKLRETTKLPRERIVLTASHTHCGPVVGTTLRSMYFLKDDQAALVRDYTLALPDKVNAAVQAAMTALKPVVLTCEVGTAGFAVNRRENKEADVPAARAAGTLKGSTDHDVPVLAAYDPDHKLVGLVFGYACHATTLDYRRWSGDYPGYAMQALEAKYPGATALFVAGCGADQNPIPRRSVELAKRYGEELATSVTSVLNRQRVRLVAPAIAEAVYAEIDLPLAEVPTREALLKASTDPNKYVASRAKMLLEKLDAGTSIPASYPYPVQTWRLGDDLVLPFLGGEVVVDYSLRLKKELGPTVVWPVAYANDVMAYIPSARVLKEGGYEGGGAMVYYGLPAVWGPNVEEQVMTEAVRQAKQVRRRR